MKKVCRHKVGKKPTILVQKFWMRDGTGFANSAIMLQNGGRAADPISLTGVGGGLMNKDEEQTIQLIMQK